MNVYMSLYLAILFIAFVPGVLVTLPPRSSKMTVLAVHALLFALAWYLTYKAVWRATEGFQNVGMNAGMNATAVPVNNAGNNGYANNNGYGNNNEMFRNKK